MTRITPEDVRTMFPDRNSFTDKLVAQMRSDATRLAEVEADRDDLGRCADRNYRALESMRPDLAALRSEVASLTPDAEMWKALQGVIGHPMRDKEYRVSCDPDRMFPNQMWRAHSQGRPIEAPDPVALLAKLDALLPKPEPEVWRWQFDLDQNTSRQTFVSAEQARHWGRHQPHAGQPVRETQERDASGTVVRTIYTREGAV